MKTRNILVALLLAVTFGTPLGALSDMNLDPKLQSAMNEVIERREACQSAINEKRWSDVVDACGYEERSSEHTAGDSLHRIAYFEKVGRKSDAAFERDMRNSSLLFAGEYQLQVAFANAFLRNFDEARRNAYHIKELLVSVNPTLLQHSDKVESDTHLYERYRLLRTRTNDLISMLK